MPVSSPRTDYRVTFAVLLLGIAAYSLLQSLVIPVLPTIQRNLHTSATGVTWVLTAYLLAASVFTPIFGRIGDVVGKQRMFVVALGALAVGSLLAALAHSIALMIAARAIQGIGGGVLPLAFGIIRDVFPRHKTADGVGAAAALAAVGTGLGIVLAGPVVKSLGYHWLFWIPMGMVIAATLVARAVFPKTAPRGTGNIGWAAAGLLSTWLVALLLALSEGPAWGWRSPKVSGLLAVAVMTAIWWVRVEARSDRPLIDMRLMRVPTVWTTNLVALLFGVMMYAVFAFLPGYVQTPTASGYGFGASVTGAGLFLLPVAVLMFVGGIVSGRLSARLGAKRVLCIGATTSVIPFVLLVAARQERWEIYLAMSLLGAGFGLAFAVMSSLIVEAVEPAQTGVASGMNANIRTIGGSLGAAVMASIVTSGSQIGGFPLAADYTKGFAVLAGASALAALAALLVPSRPHAPRPAERTDARGALVRPVTAGATGPGGETA